MRWFAFGWFATLLSVIVLLGAVSDVEGKGKGRGGGGKYKRARVHRAPTHHGSQRAGRSSTGIRSQKINSTAPTGRNGSLARQRANEQRKLDHRLGQADHLRDIAERNGNEKLLDTADRMELKAHEHYEKRIAKIDGKGGDKQPPAPGDDDGEFADDDHAMDDDQDRLSSLSSGQRHAMRRQMQNEERKLNQRLEQADHLRSIAERNGNERLLEAADRMEERALEHYTSRLDTIERQFDTSPPQPRVRQPVVDEALDRLHSPARSYLRGLVWP